MDKYVVCGSRSWPENRLLFVTAKIVELIPRDALIITGGAPGVDRHAHAKAVVFGWQTKEMPADWKHHGKSAGYIRNIEMLNENPIAVLAFWWQGSRGTAHTILEAAKRHIKIHQFTESDLLEWENNARDSARGVSDRAT